MERETSLTKIRDKAKKILYDIQTEKLYPVAAPQAERKAARIEVTLTEFLTDAYEPEVAQAQRTGKATAGQIDESRSIGLRKETEADRIEPLQNLSVLII